MTTPTVVLDLIERFKDNAEEYNASSYKELRLRTDFIDPFFEALGWDMRNEERRGEIYREVVYEDTVRISGAPKAPDYSFRVGNVRKFFVEAKQPALNLKNSRISAHQLRSYAWSANLPLSILTNFREFAVYDGRVEPKEGDEAFVARLFHFTYEEYINQWDTIASIFSREAAFSGAFDDYVWSLKEPRGSQKVDAAFLKEIETWRKALAKDIALHNLLTTRQLNDAVQRTIDRIIFLRICEDRGIEEYRRLQNLLSNRNIYSQLCELFHHADQRYNSGLFHFEEDNNRPSAIDNWTLELSISDIPLEEIIKNLYYPASPYQFSVMPADILGQVYEQFLGKVIRQTPGGGAEVEDKPEVKKAGGVYYTPTYIVDYIIENTIGRLCQGKTPEEVEALRILDPACGSGSFLISAYQYLLDWHLDWYIRRNPKKYKNRIYKGAGDLWYLTAAERKRILLKNIYGVDVDAQAVEVTKLSLLLKVLEGESAQSISDNLRLFHERALPDLDSNIKCGNSLIESDFYDDLSAESLSDEEVFRINSFDWEREFSEIMSNGGFDAVIGNPPYGAYLYEGDKSYLNSKFEYQSYQLDSYLLFLERAIKTLLLPNGIYGMIIPNPWLTNLLQKNTRRFITENTRILEIVHFKFAVFPKVTVDTQIVILQKAAPLNSQVKVTIIESANKLRTKSGNGIKQILHEQEKWRALDGDIINIFISPSEEAIASKCFNRGVPLSSLYNINVGIKPYQAGKGKPPQTTDTVRNRPYDSNVPLDDSYRPYLRGSDINRYIIAPLEPRYLRYGSWLAEPRPAANFDAPVKIFMRQTGDSLVAAIDTERYLCLNNMHVLTPKEETSLSPKYILGILNSKLLNWYYRTRNPEVGEALAEVKKTNVATLPVYVTNLSKASERMLHDRLVELVDVMLELHERLANAKTQQELAMITRQLNTTDIRIDQLVYEIYALNNDEIKVVEDCLK